MPQVLVFSSIFRRFVPPPYKKIHNENPDFLEDLYFLAVKWPKKSPNLVWPKFPPIPQDPLAEPDGGSKKLR